MTYENSLAFAQAQDAGDNPCAVSAASSCSLNIRDAIPSTSPVTRSAATEGRCRSAETGARRLGDLRRGRPLPCEAPVVQLPRGTDREHRPTGRRAAGRSGGDEPAHQQPALSARLVLSPERKARAKILTSSGPFLSDTYAFASAHPVASGDPDQCTGRSCSRARASTRCTPRTSFSIRRARAMSLRFVCFGGRELPYRPGVRYEDDLRGGSCRRCGSLVSIGTCGEIST